jgi:hypothetical protein
MLPEVWQSYAGALTFLPKARWKDSEACGTARQPQLVEGAANRAGICLPPGFVKNARIELDEEIYQKFRLPAVQFFFLFSTVFRPTLGPTQPPSQWVPWALSPGVKRQGREADYSPQSSAEVRNDGSTTSNPLYIRMA